MSEPVIALLADIARKLDILVSISRLGNRDKIQSYRIELANDPVYSKILEVTLEPISYGRLSATVAEATGVAEITVKRKIAELRENGILTTKREGKEVLYENTGLLG